MDDQTELNELEKAEANEKQDTKKVMRFLGMVLLSMLIIIAILLLSACEKMPVIYDYDPVHLV